jgi:hypothetical protein
MLCSFTTPHTLSSASAKTNHNVNEIFIELVRRVIEFRKKHGAARPANGMPAAVGKSPGTATGGTGKKKKGGCVLV